jgi:hypothetical protein
MNYKSNEAFQSHVRTLIIKKVLSLKLLIVKNLKVIVNDTLLYRKKNFKLSLIFFKFISRHEKSKNSNLKIRIVSLIINITSFFVEFYIQVQKFISE